jgi:[ribosomal protein S18]-alanine N-acetyltransferase
LDPALTIRPAAAEDLDRIVWIEENAFVDAWPFELLAYELKHPRALFLVAAWRAGEPAVGYASFRHGGGESELLRLAVDPGERRRGIASALVVCGLERLKGNGIQSCHLEVRTDNESALAFYRVLGFERTGRRRAYYRDGADALIFSRPL